MPANESSELLRPIVLFGQSARSRAAVREDEETLTNEYATEALAQYRVAYEPGASRFRTVDEPRLYPKRYPATQPFLPPSAALEWHPAQRLARYRPRRKKSGEGRKERLFAPELAAASGSDQTSPSQPSDWRGPSVAGMASTA